MPSSPPIPIIQNIVCTITIPINTQTKQSLHQQQKLPLSFLAKHMVNTEYRPSRFSALVIRIRKPVRAVALVFSTGKIVCVGTKSVEDAYRAIKRFAEMIISTAKLSESILAGSMSTFAIKNAVGSCTLGRRIDLQGFLLQYI